MFGNWFGKKCKYQSCQWEDSEYVAGPNWQEYEPVLIYCCHINNPTKVEGNCNKKLCPLTY